MPEIARAPRFLYEDAELLCVCKPAGMPAQPDPSGQEDLVSRLSRRTPVWLVHRLDTPTGGVMVFAKTRRAAAALSHLIADHAVFIKEYLCVLPRAPGAPEGQLFDWLYHDVRQNRTYPVKPPAEGTPARRGIKDARLSYRTQAISSDGTALVLVRLHTGRTHQIRAQFAARGVPLLGDGKYGSRTKLPTLALWSYRMTFPHPVTGEQVSICCPPEGELWGRFGRIEGGDEDHGSE